jgi:hypothetical protein
MLEYCHWVKKSFGGWVSDALISLPSVKQRSPITTEACAVDADRHSRGERQLQSVPKDSHLQETNNVNVQND